MLDNSVGLSIDHRFNLENAEIIISSNSVNPRGKYVRSYSHPQFVIILVKSGRTKLLIEDGSVDLSAGEYVTVAPGVHHLPKNDPNGVEMYCISINLKKLDIPSAEDLYSRLTSSLTSASGKVVRDPASFDMLMRATNLSDLTRYNAISLFAELLPVLMSDRQMPDISHLKDCTISRLSVINTIANVYYDENVSVERLAEMLHLSSRQVNRIINSVWGMSWSQLINEKRMKVAYDLILTTSMTVDEIATYVGFSTARGFFAAYKKYFGVPPKTTLKERINHEASSQE